MLLHNTGRHYDREQILEIYAIKGGYNFRDKSRHICGTCGIMPTTSYFSMGDTVASNYLHGRWTDISEKQFVQDQYPPIVSLGVDDQPGEITNG